MKGGAAVTGLKVLIVDDVPQVRRELGNILPLVGDFEVVGEATHGREAIQQAEALQPQVILMDLEMPVMDGYEATRQIKARYPSCRVIALSVHAYKAAQQKAFQAGVDGFIVKGAPVETLVQAISESKEIIEKNERNIKS